VDGGSTYRLRVPANAPVKLYWSATVYDRATHAFIREMPKLTCSSLTAGLPGFVLKASRRDHSRSAQRPQELAARNDETGGQPFVGFLGEPWGFEDLDINHSLD
jgi:hypothetical protein